MIPGNLLERRMISQGGNHLIINVEKNVFSSKIF